MDESIQRLKYISENLVLLIFFFIIIILLINSWKYSKSIKWVLNVIAAVLLLLTMEAIPEFSPRAYSMRYSREARSAFDRNDMKECRKNLRIAFYMLDDEDQRRERCKNTFSRNESVCFQILEEFHKEFDSK